MPRNPPHPGLSIRHDCLEPLDISVTEAARKLGVSRTQLSDLVNGHAGENFALDRWVFQRVDDLSSWLDVSHLGVQGREGDVTAHSYLAVINYTTQPLPLSNVFLHGAQFTGTSSRLLRRLWKI